ncbi:MAG: hypothetical protein WD069_00865 [Planctomycetales bacterium]
MRRQAGFLLQLAVLALLPVLIYWELTFRFPLIVMPACLVGGIALFWLGTKLRAGNFPGDRTRHSARPRNDPQRAEPARGLRQITGKPVAPGAGETPATPVRGNPWLSALVAFILANFATNGSARGGETDAAVLVSGWIFQFALWFVIGWRFRWFRGR